MDYTDIIQEITGALSGNWERDAVYLNQKAEEYQNHPLGYEITRAIGRLLYDLMPLEKKAEFDRLVTNREKYFDAVLTEVEKKLHEKKHQEAETLLLKIYPQEDNYPADAVSDYFAFRNPLEMAFYDIKFRPAKTIRIPPFPYNRIYQLYTYLLVEKGEYEQALQMTDEALMRNPLFTDILFEKAEIFKMVKDMDRFLAANREVISVLYTRSHLAKYYRNLGYFFAEKQLWEEAASCYLVSSNWEHTEMAQSQLYYISQMTGKIYHPDELSNWRGVLERHCLTAWPDKLWYQLAWEMGNDAFQKQIYPFAAFYFKLYTDFIQDEQAAKKLKECRQKMAS